MTLLFEGLSKSTPNPALGLEIKGWLKQARKCFSRTRINAGSENYERVLRLTKESPKPVNGKLKHLAKSLGNPKGALHLKIPKWKNFKTHIRQLTHMYAPYKQLLQNSKSRKHVPRVRGKQFIELRKLPNKKYFPIKAIKTKKHKIKPLTNPIPRATPLSLRLPLLGLKELLNGLISKYVFTKKQAKKLKKRSQLNRKPKKMYKRDTMNKSKLFKLSLQHQKQRRNEMKNKLIEVASVMQELGELKGIKNLKKLTEKMHRTILKKLSRSAINLQTEYGDLLRYNFQNSGIKRDKTSSNRTILKKLSRSAIKLHTEYGDLLRYKFQKSGIKRDKTSFPESSKTTAKRNRTNEIKLTKSCGNKGFNFKLGKGLKVHDYGFKHLKRGVSKHDAINDSKTHSPREAEIISNRKAFRTMDTNLRTSTRQTATNIFLNVNRLSDKKVNSKSELLDQLNRLETLRHLNSENFEYLQESVSPLGYEISEKLNRTFASIKRINQSKANAAQLTSDGRDLPFDFLPYDDYQVNVVPFADKKPQPLHHRRKKRSKRLVVPQTEAGTQTQYKCEICSSMQKYKTENISPLIVEMAMKRNFLNQRQYYMENLKNKKSKVPDVLEKGESSDITKSNQSDYNPPHRNHYIDKDTHLDSRYPKIISETFENLTSPLRFDNYTRELFEAYRTLDVNKILSRCYQTLFEAEQRTNGIFSNIFRP
ncbi:uncharacterized protein LOC26534976 [Drosophila yakuba]|uniref:Uncharacterized protein n=1 Tax=Drosophila yakuba TaxID=7245 RepID=A0A0R1DLZ7_DROYA|nr:uncharacterized protein LOC26534976 [Drosophila yakuba]KRJ98335.1 uncharacterized protein Dyak_GE27795 [Drosophila yakuba]